MTPAEPFRVAPSSSRYQVVGPVLRGKDTVVSTVARVETGDESQDRAMAERIAACLNAFDGIETSVILVARAGRPS